jgi:hypothetical protein
MSKKDKSKNESAESEVEVEIEMPKNEQPEQKKEALKAEVHNMHTRIRHKEAYWRQLDLYVRSFKPASAKNLVAVNGRPFVALSQEIAMKLKEMIVKHAEEVAKDTAEAKRKIKEIEAKLK